MKKIALAVSLLFVTAFSSLTAWAVVDNELPSDVDNLKAFALDSAVKVTWDASTDNVAVTGYQVHYGLTPVNATGQKYDHVKDVGNVLQYTVTELENGKKYYFSVIAYDAAENESKNWATEVSATPSEDAGASDDKDAPQVSKAEATNKEQVKVTFSEEIVLPAEDPQDAFTLDNDDNLEGLDVLKAEMDKEDTTNKTVILTTAAQTKDANYKLTVGIDIEDKAGNPIISGTSDTAVFKGSDVEPPAEDTTGPEVVKVENMDNTHVIVNFNETVVLTIDPADDFKIVEEADNTKTLTVLGVELGKNSAGVEDATAIVTTSTQEEKNYVLTALKLKDEVGNEVNAAKGSAIFKGMKASEIPPDNGDDTGDKVAPKDVAKFLADSIYKAEKFVVTLTWENPAANKGDTSEQVLYMSTDKGAKYDKKASLDPDAKKYEVKDLTAGEYWFKLTQKDAAGNESKGIITKIILSETGPEMLGLVVVSAILGRIIGKKRKAKK